MDDALFMRRLKRLGNLLGDVQRLFEGNRTFLDSLGQGWPFDQLQDQTMNPVGLFQAIDGGDVGMIERSQDMRFPLEADHALRVVGEDRRQNLEGNFTPQLGVGGAINLSHPALAEHLRDAIMRNAFAYHKDMPDLMSVS